MLRKEKQNYYCWRIFHIHTERIWR